MVSSTKYLKAISLPLKSSVEAGEKVTFDQVLVVGGDDLKVGDQQLKVQQLRLL